ncbi:MAG: prolipoprotein diacylglyceryl transferase [Armatimonadota bacterium]|nr:prolipoprotein diacylglyceryl transferase [Armatimonadota bacterium]
MYPTLTTVGPWRPVHLPAVFAFFVGLVWVWTYFERRQDDREMRLTFGLVAELVVQAAVPTAAIYLIVNRLGPLEVRSWGVMVLLSFVAAATWMYLDRDRYDFTGTQVLHVALLGFAGGIIGGRLGYVLLNLSEYAQEPLGALNLWSGGMSWHGGVAGALLVLAIGTRITGVTLARAFDLSAPAVALAYAIARVGCFLNGCCWGRSADLPWAVVFPPEAAGPSGVPLHPAQLYAVAGTLLFTLPALLALGRWLRKPFDRFLGFLVLSSVVRFVVEVFRRGASAEVFGPIPQLTIAQVASLAIIAVGVVVILVRERPEPRAG